MFKLTSLVALASLAVLAPAQAQSIPASSITVSVPTGSPCRVTAVSITSGKTANDLRFTFNNDGTSPISFQLRLTVSGTTSGSMLTRILNATLNGRQAGANTIEISGMSTPLASLANPRATAELLNCANAQGNRPLANM